MEFPKQSGQNKSSVGSEKFLRLKSGEAVDVILRGKVYVFYSKWVNEKSYVTSSEDPEASRRYKVNVIVKDNGKSVAKIFEFGGVLCDKFDNIQDTLKSVDPRASLDKYIVQITKKGSGKAGTKWDAKSIGPVKNLELIESIPLNILDAKQSSTKEVPQEPWPEEDDNLPF